jgi:hypothetical protein
MELYYTGTASRNHFPRHKHRPIQQTSRAQGSSSPGTRVNDRQTQRTPGGGQYGGGQQYGGQGYQGTGTQGGGYGGGYFRPNTYQPRDSWNANWNDERHPRIKTMMSAYLDRTNAGFTCPKSLGRQGRSRRTCPHFLSTSIRMDALSCVGRTCSGGARSVTAVSANREDILIRRISPTTSLIRSWMPLTKVSSPLLVRRRRPPFLGAGISGTGHCSQQFLASDKQRRQPILVEDAQM